MVQDLSGGGGQTVVRAGVFSKFCHSRVWHVGWEDSHSWHWNSLALLAVSPHGSPGQFLASWHKAPRSSAQERRAKVVWPFLTQPRKWHNIPSTSFYSLRQPQRPIQVQGPWTAPFERICGHILKSVPQPSYMGHLTCSEGATVIQYEKTRCFQSLVQKRLDICLGKKNEPCLTPNTDIYFSAWQHI